MRRNKKERKFFPFLIPRTRSVVLHWQCLGEVDWVGWKEKGLDTFSFLSFHKYMFAFKTWAAAGAQHATFFYWLVTCEILRCVCTMLNHSIYRESSIKEE